MVSTGIARTGDWLRYQSAFGGVIGLLTSDEERPVAPLFLSEHCKRGVNFHRRKKVWLS